MLSQHLTRDSMVSTEIWNCCKKMSLTTVIGYNGAYLEDGNVSDGVQPTAKNPGDVEKLWKLSEELVGEKFLH